MSIFSSTGLLGKWWSAVKSLFTKIEEVFLPEVITITQAINSAINNKDVDALIAAISPKLDGIPGAVLSTAQTIIPKVLAAELGLQALQSGATPQDAANWAQSVITAFAGINSSLVATSKVWTSLAASLAILFDQGKTVDKNWAYWVSLAEQAYVKIQAAIAAASAAVTTVAPSSTAATS